MNPGHRGVDAPRRLEEGVPILPYVRDFGGPLLRIRSRARDGVSEDTFATADGNTPWVYYAPDPHELLERMGFEKGEARVKAVSGRLEASIFDWIAVSCAVRPS